MGMTDIIILNEIQTRLERKIKGDVCCYMKEDDPGVVIIEITNPERRFSFKTEANLMDIYLVRKSINYLIFEIEMEYKYAISHAFYK